MSVGAANDPFRDANLSRAEPARDRAQPRRPPALEEPCQRIESRRTGKSGEVRVIDALRFDQHKMPDAESRQILDQESPTPPTPMMPTLAPLRTACPASPKIRV